MSVRPSVTLWYCIKTNKVYVMFFFTKGEREHSSFFADTRIIPKFERGYPEQGRLMRLGSVRTGDFQLLSHPISETVQDRTKIAICYLAVCYFNNKYQTCAVALMQLLLLFVNMFACL